jgi:DMSO/TMAO reductase YedYZ molybdopterin-dependent catalytic subunit
MPGHELQLDLLRGLPAVTQQVRVGTPRGSNDRTFRGATLHAYMLASGLLNAHSADRFAACYVVASAVDGFRVTVAFAEILPSATKKQVLLAYEQDGEPIRAGIRLVVPGDGLGGRSAAGIVSLETHEVASIEPAEPGELELAGLLERPGPVELALVEAGATTAAIEAQRVHGNEAPARTYSGVKVFDLLEPAGFLLDEHANEDFLSKVVVARSADGSGVVLAGGEIEPRFMDGNALVAARRDGTALEDGEGPFRLVVPYDRNPGRWAKQLVRLEFRDG